MSPRWRFALLGEKIHYTKSPIIFEAIGRILGESIQFDVHDVATAQVPAILESMKRGELDGLSVTIPHKEAVMPHLDSLSDDARQISAVNSIGQAEGVLEGYNTDWVGFSVPLLAMKKELQRNSALIFGTGGAARACMYALHKEFAIGEFMVVSRSHLNSAAVEQAVSGVPLKIVEMQHRDDWLDSLRRSVLVVNATPLGGGNEAGGGELLEAMKECQGRIYYDLNYNDDNELTRAAIRAGAAVVDGKQMLVAQAVVSMRLWTGLTVPFEAVFKTVFPAAAERRSDKL